MIKEILKKHPGLQVLEKMKIQCLGNKATMEETFSELVITLQRKIKTFWSIDPQLQITITLILIGMEQYKAHD